MRFHVMLAAALAALAVPASAAAAKPPCTAAVIEATLVAGGHITQEEFDGGGGVNLMRCGDVTADGVADVVFTLASGGTAGDTSFGVIRGGSNDVVLYKPGYKTGIARHNRRSFDVLLPHYRRTDPNCCPSSFRRTRYTWTGKRFKASKAKKLKTAPARFYRR